ncbi:uncharacterized protein LY89DRAFT_691783 [Mollisia scopiformis]|uniref:UBX domain-containing protein n=1 Tax=Mollisia scopiformis TaxID=149040 RepID=A0A132B4I6_MOLSC|nr:uncharacterized protein LY89DRAFT_691783 [Mollisia scopiformis]KUJ07318.1 hypothetical protein LY89DRAFT_691783 [Mollisia scopiformis]
MFYEGDLQSGISKAIQEDKLVACFVTDDGGESLLWEEFLREENLKSSLATHTILLRLKAGSQEAGYLAAIFPLPKTPVIVIIKNGELKEYLAAGISREDFMRRIGVVLETKPSIQSSSTSAPVAPNPSGPPTGSSQTGESSTSTPQRSTSLVAQSLANELAQSRAAQDTQAMLAERSARLEVQKKEHDKKEKAKRAEEAKARREAAEKAAAPGSKAGTDAKYALMQKKRQQEARDERARILKRVEDDKAERREKEAARRAEAKAKAEEVVPPTGSSSIAPPFASKSAECALQIRLFDGSTIRSRFPSQGSLRKDVRPWIDEKQSGDVPYTFKHVLSPLPNKNIETSEEERTLQSLGLTPSATLILLPVTNATNAYEGNSGLVSRGVSAGYGIVSSGVGLVTGVLGSLLGAGPTQPANDAAQVDSTDTRPSANIRTLRDQNAGPDDQQFYNGNALNFEPRHDDEDKKDD